MTRDELKGAIEAILFVSQKPVKASKIFTLLSEENFSMEDLNNILSEIKKDKEASTSGVYLAKVSGAWQFRTKDLYAKYINKLEGIKTLRLSSAAMEVLSIIAYNQPVTKVFVQEIRSIDSSHIFKQLLDKGFIKIDGRATDIPGSPFTYTTTKFFLEYFGLNDLSELPSVNETFDMLSTGTETDVKLDFINNLKEIKNIDFANDKILEEHDDIIKELTKVLKNGQVSQITKTNS